MKVLVLGGGADQITLISQLKERGAFIVLVDYYPNPPAKEHADIHHMTSTLDLEAVVAIAQKEAVDYVITACIDQALLSMAYVAEKLNLQCPLSYKTALSVTHKAFMKEVMVKNGIPTSRHKVIRRGEDFSNEGLEYPLVVKPCDSNGSYGVRMVHTRDQLAGYIGSAQEISRSGQAIIEEFRDGEEVSADIFIKEKKAKVIMLTTSRKIQNTDSAFPIYQSRYAGQMDNEAIKKIERVADQIASSFNLDNTPLLLQVIYNQREASVIEFGVRIAGGSKHHLIREVTGFDIMKAYVDSFFGLNVRIDVCPTTDHVCMNYVYAKPGIFSKIENIDKLKNEGMIREYYMYKTPGMQVSGCLASRDRICSFMARAKDEKDLDRKITQAVKSIRVLSERGEDMMLREIFL